MKKSKISDFAKIKVTSNGAFYMSSEDIFDDREKILIFLEKMNTSLQKRLSIHKKEPITEKNS